IRARLSRPPRLRGELEPRGERYRRAHLPGNGIRGGDPVLLHGENLELQPALTQRGRERAGANIRRRRTSRRGGISPRLHRLAFEAEKMRAKFLPPSSFQWIQKGFICRRRAA